VYSDNFDDADFSDWTYKDFDGVNLWRWRPETGYIRVTDVGANGFLEAPYTSDSTDYSITVDARPRGGAVAGWGIVFGYVDADNYWVFKWNDSVKHKYLVQYSGGTEYIRGTSSYLDATTDQWYEFNVTVTSTTITCKIDTTTIFTYSASPALNYSGLLTKGNANTANYDNYSIEEFSASGDGPTITPQGNYHMSEYMDYLDQNASSYTTIHTLQFTPESADEQWVVVVTWKSRDCRADTNTDSTGIARILVNGVERTGLVDIGYKQYASNWKGFAQFFKITGTTSQQTITFQADSWLYVDNTDRVRIVAFKIPNPANADINYFEDLGPDVNTSQTDYNLTFSPSSAGDYIIMACSNEHEAPGNTSSGDTTFIDHASTVQTCTGDNWQTSAEPYVTLFHIQKVTLTTGSKTFKIRHNPDTTNGSTIRHVVLLAFRADVFEDVLYAEQTTDADTTSTSWQDYLTLSPTAASEHRDHVYLATFHREPYAAGHESNGRITFDSAIFLQESIDMNRAGLDSQLSMAYADTSKGDKTIKLQHSTKSGDTARARGGYIVVLRYPPPNQAPSTPTIDNYNTGAWTNDNTPTLQFDISDPDSGDIIKYQVQADTNTSYPPDWASLAVDYTEGSGSASPRSNVQYTTGALSNSANSSTYYYWRVKAIDDGNAASSWAAASSGFRVDTAAPSAGPTVKCTNYLSLSTSQWQNTISNPGFKWDGTDSTYAGTDTLSGINTSNYSYYWGTSVSGTPATTVGTSVTPGAVSSCTTYYLRLTTRDNAGNAYGPYTNFTFKYDATNPSISLVSPYIGEGTNPDYQCLKAGDNAYMWFNSNYSGSFAVHTSQSDQANGALLRKVTHPSLGTGWTGGGDDISVGAQSSVSDIYETYTWTAGAADPGLKTIYVYDGAIYTGTNGNSSSCTFTVADDPNAPTNPTSVVETGGSQTGVTQGSVNDPNFTWSGAADTGGSGVAGYYWYFGTNSGADPSTWTTSAGCNPSAVASYNRYYLRVKTKDNVSNVSAAATLFTFIYVPSVSPVSVKSASTWYQGDKDVEVFGFSHPDVGTKFTKFYYKWDRSPSTAVTTGDSNDWTTTSVKNFTPYNSKSMYLHTRAANSSGDLAPNTDHSGPYYFVDTERLLRHGRFFDDDGILIEAGPKSP
jgi:hypothetical protein